MIRQGGPSLAPRDRDPNQPPGGHSTIADDGVALRMSQLAAELGHDLRVPLSSTNTWPSPL